jgi:hypothetical protein
VSGLRIMCFLLLSKQPSIKITNNLELFTSQSERQRTQAYNLRFGL